MVPRVGSLDVRDEEPTGVEQVADSPRERQLELAVTILLAAAALLSAWCAYQSSAYSSRENAGHATAARLQVLAARADDRATEQTLLDVSAFYEWLDATTAGDVEQAAVLRERFRDEMQPAFDTWLASDPFDNADAPATPLELPAYRLASAAEAIVFDTRAQAAATGADDAGTVGDRYLLAVVLYAAALFQLGIQSRIGVFGLRATLVVISGVIIVGTTIWILTLPKQWPG
jgi:hypothetical protein